MRRFAFDYLVRISCKSPKQDLKFLTLCPFILTILIFVNVSAPATFILGAGIILAVVVSFPSESGIGAAIFAAVAVSMSTSDAATGYVGSLVWKNSAVLAANLVLLAIGGLSVFSAQRRQQGPFPSFFCPAMLLACLGAASWLPLLDNWESAGPLFLVFGLLTLLNAPFDWTSLGLTRALLRRGLELGGWWPYVLALVDAALAAVIIAVLALTMVVGVQASDTLAVHGGGTAVLPLDTLLKGIAEYPSAPEYSWLYALLLSTMIPSLVNLMIGGASLVRGLPGLPSLLLRKIPAQGNVPKFRPRLDRHCPYLPGRCWCGLGYPPPRSFWSW
jgi:hypothetical protein